MKNVGGENCSYFIQVENSLQLPVPRHTKLLVAQKAVTSTMDREVAGSIPVVCFGRRSSTGRALNVPFSPVPQHNKIGGEGCGYFT